MRVLLYAVGRNLNRAYRTAEAFGIERLLLWDCQRAYLAGNLFGAAGRVEIEEIATWPGPAGILLLETWAERPLWGVDWQRVTTIAIGGESRGLAHGLAAEQCATIPMGGHISGLTVEAALAIALYEWRRAERRS